MECARSWLVQMGSKRLPSLILFDEFGNLGTKRTVIRIGELHLVMWIVVVIRSFPHVDYRWW